MLFPFVWAGLASDCHGNYIDRFYSNMVMPVAIYTSGHYYSIKVNVLRGPTLVVLVYVVLKNLPYPVYLSM